MTRAVAEHPGAVVALGAGHTSYTDPGHPATVRAAPGRCRDVIHVLPFPDRALSPAALRHRCATDKGRSWIVDGHDFLAHRLDDPGTRGLATRTIHTGDETPARSTEHGARSTVRLLARI
ncbi:hypothetical protein [Streptomyces yaizuensis]|uniref:Class I SAM-dependent methyltransferase n=1 Tax=Streptomyces yaizuensis TaxID=2989713 RepID=A0ABQ5PBE5_9ACTN|nr:hypothetical protein [Streptomyces sp. YSPA8]GLF99888.1 hypothetical protein SYYSPA8_36345 [Streptomyces sp. YSPA8]